MKTVALVAHEIHDGGGMERAFAELLRGASGSDYRFVVIARELDESLRPLVEWRRVRSPGRPFPLKFLGFALAAGRELRRTHTDLVHTLGAIVPNQADLTTVQFCHAGFVAATGRLAPGEAPPLRRLNTALSRLLALAFERWCYRPSRLRRFGAVSRGVAAELERHYPVVPRSLTPNGVDCERYRAVPHERQRFRADQGVRADDVVALFVGGDWDRKGLGVALEGIALAGVPLTLWVVGDGDAERFERRASELGVTAKFFGRRTDTESFYRAADLLLLPTLYETFSLVAHEAAASGLPVVATRVSGIDELVGEQEAGMLVERNPRSVGAALARLAGDPELRHALGEEARRRAAHYSWERSVRTTIECYEELCATAR